MVKLVQDFALTLQPLVVLGRRGNLEHEFLAVTLHQQCDRAGPGPDPLLDDQPARESVAHLGLGEIVHFIVLWLDDHFAVQALNLSQNHQDSVIVLRVSLVKALFINRQMVYTHPEGFLEVSTALGTLLQPMVIAGAIAAAWPRRPVAMLLGVAFALCATMLLLVVDIALSLYAYVWDMFHAHYVPDAFSPLLAWLQFMNGGGRLGLGGAHQPVLVDVGTS